MKKSLVLFGYIEKVCTFALANERVGKLKEILFYGVMVAQQILVLFVLVRVQVEQLFMVYRSQYTLFYGVMVAQQILVLFVLVRVQVEQHENPRYSTE